MPKKFKAEDWIEKQYISIGYKLPSKYAPLLEEILEEDCTNLSNLTRTIMKNYLEKESKKRKLEE